MMCYEDAQNDETDLIEAFKVPMIYRSCRFIISLLARCLILITTELLTHMR